MRLLPFAQQPQFRSNKKPAGSEFGSGAGPAGLYFASPFQSGTGVVSSVQCSPSRSCVVQSQSRVVLSVAPKQRPATWRFYGDPVAARVRFRVAGLSHLMVESRSLDVRL